ncbi:MAG TPA: SPOR domain-containing protein, partial [Rhizomicrobium sp.]|nr:SPOR domain-containing protein [Rhizomicrobium sp.]
FLLLLAGGGTAAAVYFSQQAAPEPVVAAPVTPPPAPKPSVAPAATGAPRTLPGVAAATPAPAKPVAQAAAQPAPKPAAASGAYVLQIGAFKSQAEADSAWRAYKARHAALLTGYGPDVQKADLGDKGTWYRLRIAGFADRDVAAALCDRLKADSGACFLGK